MDIFLKHALLGNLSAASSFLSHKRKAEKFSCAESWLSRRFCLPHRAALTKMVGSCWDTNTAASTSLPAPTSFPAAGGTERSSAITTSPKPAVAPSLGSIMTAYAADGFCRDSLNNDWSERWKMDPTLERFKSYLDIMTLV